MKNPDVRFAPSPPDPLRRSRLIGQGRSDRVVRVGLPRRLGHDLYHQALTTSWPRFAITGLALYLAVNLVFAGLYSLNPGGISGARPGHFADAFFFSVQTIATIGYGGMSPASLYVNLLVTAETMVGLSLLAIASGLLFARFSRPTARVLFSRNAVVNVHNGQSTLTIRLGNERRNRILQAEANLSLLRWERSAEGAWMRRFHDLALVRMRTPVFALTFSVMHVIDEMSPLFGATRQSLEEEGAELVAIVIGLDESLSQPIHARASYGPEQILWGRRFADVIGTGPAGQTAIDYRRFHDTEVADTA